MPEKAPAQEALEELPVVDAEHYQLLGEVARGGIGTITKAYDRRLSREVALKQLRDGRSGRGRFIREAMLTARLQHPSIIPVHELGRFASGEPFLAMKLVHGQSLREAIDERPSLEQRLELIGNVIAVADAISYAHSQRVIHRDLKPSNVLIGAFGETVVIDWGLAKDLDAEDPFEPPTPSPAPGEPIDITKTGDILGTPVYMPPEQALGESVDERADVYSLGALLYHVIAGTAPFSGRDGIEVVRKVVSSSPPILTAVVPGVSADLAAIVARAMARPKDQRYAQARALADDLRRYQLGQIPTVREQEAEYDAALEAQLDVELRAKAVRPTRVTCWLAIVLVPLFGFAEAALLKSVLIPTAAVRLGTVVALAGILIATYRPAGRRLSLELGLAAVFVVGEMLIIVNQLTHGKLQDGFSASILLVFLSCSTLMHMPSRRVVIVLSAITGSYLIATLTFPVLPTTNVVTTLMFFGSAILIAAIGVRFSFGLQRAEFYTRRRLETANVRLAKLEQSA